MSAAPQPIAATGNRNVRGLLARWSARIAQHEDYVFLLLTIVIGALVGLIVVAFILLTENINQRLFPVHGAGWRRVLMPVLGSLGMGFLLARYFPNARGSGIPQTKAALFAHNGYISLRTVLGKFFCTSATLASGIPLGREGPSVQVGAGIASVLGRHLGLSEAKVKSLIPVAAAAAIAAAFNTPLAAVVFALEEVMGDLNAPMLGSVVLSSATSAAAPLAHDNSATVALEKLREYGCRSWPVADKDGPLGMVCIATIQEFKVEARDARTAGELVEKNDLHVHADQPLELALERMGAGGVDALPVVTRSNLRKLVGIVVLKDILSVYRVDAWLKPPDENTG